MSLPSGVRRWFQLRTRADIEREIDEELRFHIDSRADELVRQGLVAEAARLRALQEFGDVAAARVELSGYARRQFERSRRAQWWSDIGADFRLAVRSLKQRPGFAITLALTLGLGLGANLVTFDVADRLLFRPPAHVVDAAAVKRMYFQQTFPFAGLVVQAHTTYADFLVLQRNSRSFEALGAFSTLQSTLGRGEGAEQIRHGVASATFFDVLGVRPYLGRFYSEEEDSPPHGSAVAVLDYDFWQRRFGGRREAIGQELLLDRQAFTIVGVAPRGFTGAGLSRVDVWTPVTVTAEARLGAEFPTSRDFIWLRLVGRSKPGVTAEQAQQELTALWKRVGEPAVAQDATSAILIAPIQEARGPAETNLGRSARVAKWLGGVSLLVLLVACANAANLMLTRTIRNRRDVGIRLALGVGRGRLLRQFLVEGLVFVSVAALAALLFAHWGSSLLHLTLLRDLNTSEPVLNARMLVFLGVAALFTLFATMVPPAVQMTKTSVIPALKSGARDGQPRSHMRTALLFLQAAFSVVLLVGATMFVRSLHNASRFDLGFDPRQVLVAEVNLRQLDFDPARSRSLFEEAHARVGRLNGVDAVAIGSTVPMQSNVATEFRAEGVDSLPIPKTGGPYYVVVTPEFFRTLGTRIVRGRGFTAEDRKVTPRVAVLGETMSRLIWPTEDALGKCVYIAGSDACTTVVGIAEDVRSHGINRDDLMQYYLPLAQEQTHNAMFTLFVRAKDEPSALIGPITREIQALHPELPYVSVRPLQAVVDPELESWRLGAMLFTAFGVLSLLLAGIGLYSMLSWVVASRTREMGLRMALGARPVDVIRLVVSDGMKVATAGVLAGIGVAVVASRQIAPLLFELSPRAPASYVIGGSILLAVALIAALIPARRATAVEPAITLNAE